MKKQESQTLMIGSWVLVNGEPRQVCALTNRKAGFKSGANRDREFFVFNQLQSINLSEEILKECVKVNTPELLIPEYMSVEFMNNIVVIKERNENVDYLQFPNLHTMQSFFLSRYGCTVVFDADRYLFLQQPEMVVTKEQIEVLKEQMKKPSIILAVKDFLARFTES